MRAGAPAFRLTALVATGLALALLTACAAVTGSADADRQITLRVFAASSLTETFTALGAEFESQHPDTEVELNFAASSGLAEQIRNGAPADVFASASPSNMDALVQAEQVAAPQDFASNSLEIAVPPANPGRISSLTDLARPGVKVALCQPEVPCGKVSAEVLASAQLTVRAATEEVDVKSVLTKVTLGEVDAGLVYVTDVLAAGAKVTGVPIATEVNAETSYPIAAVTGSEHRERADEFVDLVLSPTGAKVLESAGFQGP